MDSKKLFKHLSDIDETYGQHFSAAAWSGLKMVFAGIALIIHAICPAVFLTTGSDLVKKTANFFIQRAAAKQKTPPTEPS